MRHRLTLSLALTLVLAVLSSPSSARKAERQKVFPYSAPSTTTDLPPDLRHFVSTPLRASASSDTIHLGWWGFDTNGNPDAQSWVSVDDTGPIGDFFWVQDATILDGGDFGRLNVLEGAQSMWCGAPAGYPPLCNYATLPGYGNSWNQSLVSKVFTGCDSIEFSFKVEWDSEPGYDFTTVQWRSTNPVGPWMTLNSASGSGTGGGYYTGWGFNPVEILGFVDPTGSSQIRFWFTSDGAWSDEDGMWPSDGAVIIDSLTVKWYNEIPPDSDNWVLSGTYYEDFEDESPGDHVTTDGCWTSVPGPVAFGDYAALYSGVTVLQRDPCFLNGSGIWGFFDDPMITNYACGGFPNQGAVPYGPSANGLYMMNSVVSPKIPIVGTGDKFLVKLKVYRNLPLNALIYWDMDIRTWINDCPTRWFRGAEFVNFGDQQEWAEMTENVSANVDPTASHLQVRLEALDMCAAWCGVFGSGACHTQGPLFDDVHVLRVNDIGPSIIVNHIHLFQDNFAADGTTTGKARADMAADIMPQANPTILPGDSICLTASNVGTDPFTGVGPSVYVYVAVWPTGQANKTPQDLEAPETRAGVGKRYPFVNSVVHDGVTWACFRADQAVTTGGSPIADRYCFDLNDFAFTPGDTVCYVLCADDGIGNANYFSRRLDGQGVDFVTDDLWEALNSPMEFTILPANAINSFAEILYVDDADDRPGPPELFFHSVMSMYGVGPDYVDRYDVLGPSSAAGNSLASRVTNLTTQLQNYPVIVWDTQDLSAGLIGDGPGGNPEKSDDFSLLFDVADQSFNQLALLLSGDDIAEEWVTSPNAGAVNLRAVYMNFNLVDGDHVNAGEPLSPLLHLDFCQATTVDFIAYGGCPSINDFDVLQATGGSISLVDYPNGAGSAVVGQNTPNAAASNASIALMGFAYSNMRDVAPGFPPARMPFFYSTTRCLSGGAGPLYNPTGIERVSTNFLASAAPNPFNPTTTISYGIRTQGHVTLRVYNVAGQLVRTLVNETKTPRPEGFSVTWDGMSDRGDAVATGVYFYKLAAGDFVQTKKMVLLK